VCASPVDEFGRLAGPDGPSVVEGLFGSVPLHAGAEDAGQFARTAADPTDAGRVAQTTPPRSLCRPEIARRRVEVPGPTASGDPLPGPAGIDVLAQVTSGADDGLFFT